MRARLLASLLASSLALLAAPRVAHAFCGFYVSPGESKLTNDATMVALMREGTRTAISMSNNYRGPAADFALVVPVPVVLKKEDVRTLPRDLFERLEKVTAPRLVEYWEQDPCPNFAEGIGLGMVGGFGHGSGGKTGMGSGGGKGEYHVKIEAQFEVGEYDIVILSAEESGGLERWLRDNHYNIPEGAAAALAPYVKEQQKFFVAKVDVKKVKMDAAGVAVLSPLRFAYESADFRLPVRLGLLNAPAGGAAQDLVIWILNKENRFEAANYENTFAPTNIEVSDETRKAFPAFYATLFDASVSKAGGKAIVTEYAWSAGSCDPCPIPPLDDRDIATLGGDALSLTSAEPYKGPKPKSHKMIDGAKDISGKLPPEVVTRVVRAHYPILRVCSEKASKPDLAGTVVTSFEIGTDGKVASAKTETGTFGDKDVEACVLGVFQSIEFPEPEGGTVKVRYALDFQLDEWGGSAGFFGAGTPMVITRLHTRYDASTLGEDIVFRSAKPVQGGREVWMSAAPSADAGSAPPTLEKGATPASMNNFQARYVIRHPWTGPITCDHPRRGVWGGPWKEEAPKPVAATGLAGAPRDVKLASYVTGGLDDVASWDKAAADRPKPAAGPAPATVLPTTEQGGPLLPDAPRTTKSCHCTVAGSSGSSGGPPMALGLSLLGLAASRRRRRSR
jgi:MYXO-CTERM domain-containing protein